MPSRLITLKNTALAAGTALVANLIIFAIGSAADATWDAGSPYPIGAPMVALFSILPLVLGAAWFFIAYPGRREATTLRG